MFVRVTNDSSEEEFAALRDKVDRDVPEPDALAHYLRTMKRAALDGAGGLGLARVRFEAQLDIRVRRKSATRVIVEAEGPLRAPRLPLSEEPMASPSFAARMPALQVAEEKYSAHSRPIRSGIRVHFRGRSAR